MRKSVNALFLIGIIGTFVFGAHLLTALGGAFWNNKDIWWTPKTSLLSLKQAEDQAVVFFKDDLLNEQTGKNKLLFIREDGSEGIVKPGDISLRVNNWYKTKSSFLLRAIPAAFILGISLAFLGVGMVKMIRPTDIR